MVKTTYNISSVELLTDISIKNGQPRDTSNSGHKTRNTDIQTKPAFLKVYKISNYN